MEAVEQKKYAGITGSTLKIIAIVTMFIDHIGAAVLEYALRNSQPLNANPGLWDQVYLADQIIRQIGRLAFPIFCFLLVEGFLHTSNVKKYALRLALFALVSEVPFDLAVFGTLFDPKHQNVFFTLLIGLLVMIAADRFREKVWVQVVIYAAGMAAGLLLQTDYGYKGVLLIIILYIFRYERKTQALAGALTISWELTAPLAFLPILAYNGKRGLSMRYFFYWFYPVHLLILCALRPFFMQLF
ncbi:MAG: TraX family protein [Lachnospiraceae bacterium]|jgi:hypothetical protein|nr:TraX family protein [Lachnospiraceae bacterium]